MVAIYLIAIDSNAATYNSYGTLGYLNVPSAFTNQEQTFNISFLDGREDRKLLITGSPYDWLDASLYYSDINTRPYAKGSNRDYQDKGYSFKIRLKDKDSLPAIGLGINDLTGTGYYSSEYIVFSDSNKKWEYSIGIGWGLFS